MREKILSMLETEYPEIDFNITDSLIDDGVLDSLTITGIISLLSLEFQVMIPYEEIVEENFNSLDAMVVLMKKLGIEE